MIGTLFQTLVPLLILGGAAFFFVRNRKLISAGEQSWARFRLGEVAQRMHLSIVQGDPTFNLMMAYAQHDAKRMDAAGGVIGVMKGDGTKESRALLQGATNGRPTELSYHHRTDLDVGVVVRKTTQTFECRLSMQVARPFPPFEVVLREPMMGMSSPPVMSLPLASFGDPALDARFMLFAADPRVGPAIAHTLAPLTSLYFFHLRAQDQSVGFFATIGGMSVALPALEQVQYTLDRIGSILEGKSA